MQARQSRGRTPGPTTVISTRQVLDSALAEVICTANDAYLHDLARSEPRGGVDNALPPGVMASLSALDGVARRRIAAVPFTLFSMRFNDPSYWQTLLERPVTGQRHAAGDGFGRTAVFLAWHVVQAGPATAGVTLGMSSEVAALYQWMPLVELDRIGGLAQAAMAPRWPTHSAFWQRLLAAARSTVAIETARFMGLQLLAAESLLDARMRARA